ncbi:MULTISPECIES: helix-turn-helix domain-containing protein [unclassified Sinorhizobium]|uniref:helix-turn-helix domain-containing protein n=1 Tax=unclassified Sinorhizobium TaxID=2613772 RepID=UPI00352356E5
MSISLNKLDHSGSTAVNMDAVGVKVRALRESVGYSIEDLAVTCGLTNSEISDIEEGRDSDPAKLRRIASALQVSLSAFLGADE